jgi:enolase
MAIAVKRVIAYEISDSNGNPTIEAEMLLSNGFKITSSISSDNVINTYGMRELRDNDMQHFQGLGVKNAVATINNVLGPKFVNMNPADQIAIDNWLDKADDSSDKSKLGINTIAVLSQLFAKAGAYAFGVPVFRYINETYKRATKEQMPILKSFILFLRHLFLLLNPMKCALISFTLLKRCWNSLASPIPEVCMVSISQIEIRILI